MLYDDPTNEGRAARIDEVREAYWNARCEVEDDVEEFVADLVNMKFEDYWENYGELHASMCGGDIKQFAKEIWMSANVKTEELKEAAIALVQRLELDKDVKNNN